MSLTQRARSFSRPPLPPLVMSLAEQEAESRSRGLPMIGDPDGSLCEIETTHHGLCWLRCQQVAQGDDVAGSGARAIDLGVS